MLSIEVKRGAFVESRHHCSVAVVDAKGHLRAEFGDIYMPVFPRSSVKAIQALPFVETGGADQFGLSDAELALCCSSHSGEDRHADAVTDLLKRLGLDETALACGPSWPFTRTAITDYAASGGQPRPLRHNCSGKHAGFLGLAQSLNASVSGYHNPDHKVQQAVLDALQDVTSYTIPPHQLGEGVCRDGCSIPAYQFPLRALAHGFARMATGQDLPAERATAARRLMDACMAHPEMVGGTNRFDSRIMAAGQGKIFAKTGAEGVYCGALMEEGLGIAVKCQDGATRAAEIAFGAAVAAFHGEVLEDQDQKLLTNNAGLSVGEITLQHDYYGWVYGDIQRANYES